MSRSLASIGQGSPCFSALLIGTSLALIACSGPHPTEVSSVAGVSGGMSGGSGAAATSPGTSGEASTSGGASGSGGAATGGTSGLAGLAGMLGAAGSAGGMALAPETPRVVVLTDIANEPDDEESLVRFLAYSNELDVEALIATTSRHLRTNPREDLIRRQLDAYEQVRPNLIKHDARFPTADELRNVTSTGQTGYGMALVGEGRKSAGSNQLIERVDAADTRPIWMTVWGGANTLAQALFDVRASRTAEQLGSFIAKLRVYAISDQDDAGAWLRKEFPDLFYIVSPSPAGASQYGLSTWSGISGDQHYDNGPSYLFELVDNPWLSSNVRQGHGPLGALYPAWKYIMEGDTPAYLGLIERGLGWAISPGYGGWGGRYAVSQPAGEPREIWTNSSDTFADAAGETATSNQATIWRWRQHYQHDFAARMDWCVADSLAKANHSPMPVLNGDHSMGVLMLPVKAGSSVALDATGTSDPDSNAVHIKWWIYPEAGTLPAGATLSASEGSVTEVSIPLGPTAGKLHVILEAEDDGNPALFAYRRMILDVTP